MLRRLVIWTVLGLAGFALGRAMAESEDPARVASRREAPESPRVAREEPVPEPDEPWIERAESTTWAIRTFHVGRQMRSRASVAQIEETYHGIRQPLRRWHFVRGLVQNGPCPFVHDVIRWMQADPDPELRRRAFTQIRNLSFRSFEEDPEGLRQWQEKYGHRPPRDAYLGGMREFAERLRASDEGAQRALIDAFPGPFFQFNWNAARLCGLHIRDAAERSGLSTVLLEIAADGQRSVDTRRMVFEMLGAIDPPRGTFEPVARAALDDPELRVSALLAVKECSGDWVFSFLRSFIDQYPRERTGQDAYFCLAYCNDERAFPLLIAHAFRFPEPRARGELLNILTEARDKPVRDVEWWVHWWERNRHRFGEAARSIDLEAESWKAVQRK